jgi:hypothetical protein
VGLHEGRIRARVLLYEDLAIAWEEEVSSGVVDEYLRYLDWPP